MLQHYNNLSRLAHDFVYTAKKYGTLIITERYLPDSQKTIRPVTSILRGVAGGAKFLVHGVLFKFSDDHHGLYGGIEHASKASKLDLRGCAAVFGANEPYSGPDKIHVPLMGRDLCCVVLCSCVLCVFTYAYHLPPLRSFSAAVIDYRGFRLTAMSVLPIGPATLIYGTADTRTVRASNPHFNFIAERMAKRLNLKIHHIQGIPLALPFDCEGHKGKDGRWYLCDFARLFPPQAHTEHSPPGAHLFQLLRPELVASNPVPLSPDAYLPLGKHDAAVNHAELTQATERLFKEVCAYVLYPLRWCRSDHSCVLFVLFALCLCAGDPKVCCLA